MLTQDENIVDIRFTVQYRLKDARAYLFENRDPGRGGRAGRRVGGARDRRHAARSTRCSTSSATPSPPTWCKSIQAQLDRLKAGILVVNVNLQSVQPPEQVQAAFDDALKAGADRDRLKNEGQAYASDVIPKAQGTAARLREEAEGYKSRVVAQAEGDAQRFRRVLTEYQKAPAVTRDRLYIDTMQQVYSQRQQGDGRQPQQLEPAVPAARQADAAGRRPAAPPAAPRRRRAAPSRRRRPRPRPTSRSRDGQRTRDRDGR